MGLGELSGAGRGDGVVADQLDDPREVLTAGLAEGQAQRSDGGVQSATLEVRSERGNADQGRQPLLAAGDGC